MLETQPGASRDRTSSPTSIRRSLARAILITTGTALVLSAAATVALEVFRYRESAEASTLALARVLGSYSVSALEQDDEIAGRDALAALEREGTILAAALFDADGASFAHYVRSGSRGTVPTHAATQGLRYDGNTLRYLEVIDSGSGRAGYVYLHKDLSGLAGVVWQSVGAVAGIMLLSLLLASITASRLREQIAFPLEIIGRSVSAMEQGDLSIEAKVDRRDEIGSLATAFNRTREGLRSLVSEVRANALAISDDTLILSEEGAGLFEQARTQQATVTETSTSVERLGVSAREVRDNIDGIAATATETASSVVELNATARRIDEHMDALSETVDAAVSSIAQLSAAARQIASNADGVGLATRTTSSSVEVLRASVETVEANAKECEGLSAGVSTSAEQGSLVVGQVIGGMERIRANFQGLEKVVVDLAQRSKVIDDVVKVIDGVVAETNLLALNASIISSHAGEHGRAFAVVAQEVKSLAERTAGSTREISQAMEAVRSGIEDAVSAVADGAQLVQRGVGLSEEAGTALGQIRESAGQSSQKVSAIVRATAEQANDINAVDHAMTALDGGVSQITVGTHEQDNVASELLDSIEQMRQLAREVKVATSEQSRQSGHMSRAVEEVASGVHVILGAAEDQHRDIRAIVESLGVFERNTELSTRRAEAMRRCVESLSNRAGQLEDGVGRFKV